MIRRVITYWGIKTGVGTTINSILMAKRLKQLGFKVLLWDLNFKNPNIHLYCNSIDNIHNINNIFTFVSSNNVTEELIKDNIQSVKVGKNFELDYLRGISNLSYSVTDCLEELKICYNIIQEMYDYVVIDVSNDLNNSGTYFSLSIADTIFLLADRNVITIRQFDMFRQHLKTQFNYDNCYLLVNKVSDKVIIPSEDIETYLDLKNKEVYEIPYIPDELLLDSINKGEVFDFLTSNNKIMELVDDKLDYIINKRINSEIKYEEKKNKKFSFFKK